MVRFACLQFLHLIWQYNLEVKMASNFLRKKIETHSILKGNRMGLMKLVFFNLFLNELHGLYTEELSF